MSADQGHGVEVEIDSLRSALITTQTLRLALDVLWDNMPPDMETDTVRTAFYELHDRLIKESEASLRTGVLSRGYFIVSPINPRNLPSPEDMEKIAAAFCTLDDLGLILTP